MNLNVEDSSHLEAEPRGDALWLLNNQASIQLIHGSRGTYKVHNDG